MTRHEAASLTAEEVEAIRQRMRQGISGMLDAGRLLRALDEQAAELARLRRVEAAAWDVRCANTDDDDAHDALYAALDGSGSDG
jgi:hypothetical protein